MSSIPRRVIPVFINDIYSFPAWRSTSRNSVRIKMASSFIASQEKALSLSVECGRQVAACIDDLTFISLSPAQENLKQNLSSDLPNYSTCRPKLM